MCTAGSLEAAQGNEGNARVMGCTGADRRPLTPSTQTHFEVVCDLTWSCSGERAPYYSTWPGLTSAQHRRHDLRRAGGGGGGANGLGLLVRVRERGEEPVMVSDVFAYRPRSLNPSGMGLWSVFIPEGLGPHTHPWQTVLQTPPFPLLLITTSGISFYSILINKI